MLASHFCTINPAFIAIGSRLLTTQPTLPTLSNCLLPQILQGNVVGAGFTYLACFLNFNLQSFNPSQDADLILLTFTLHSQNTSKYHACGRHFDIWQRHSARRARTCLRSFSPLFNYSDIKKSSPIDLPLPSPPTIPTHSIRLLFAFSSPNYPHNVASYFLFLQSSPHFLPLHDLCRRPSIQCIRPIPFDPKPSSISKVYSPSQRRHCRVGTSGSCVWLVHFGKPCV
jgi:hypothetical protein